jgi:DNA-binding response OmpR family regulator
VNSRKKARPVANTRKSTILLVDDDPSVRQMIGRVLANEGYLVLCAANGAEALGIAAANHIDLVLLDLNMPVKGGWDTFERLTAENPLVAVIIITARPNQLFTALGAGVGALLEKPLDFPVLLQTVSALLAEPVESRLARLAGHHTDFHYLPSTGAEVSR